MIDCTGSFHVGLCWGQPAGQCSQIGGSGLIARPDVLALTCPVNFRPQSPTCNWGADWVAAQPSPAQLISMITEKATQLTIFASSLFQAYCSLSLSGHQCSQEAGLKVLLSLPQDIVGGRQWVRDQLKVWGGLHPFFVLSTHRSMQSHCTQVFTKSSMRPFQSLLLSQSLS